MNIFKKFTLILFLVFNYTNDIFGQYNFANPINSYVIFANESSHGMLIAHRVLEGFNQKVNKYVDLQSNQFNFYGNKDLPKDLFEDPEKWFYEISPQTWKKKIESSSWSSPYKKELDLICEQMALICNSVNQIRFDMENFIHRNDLRSEKNQIRIFEQLKNCEALYDRYYEFNDQLHSILNTFHDASNINNSEKENYRSIQQSIKSILEIIHYGYTDELESHFKQFIKSNAILQGTTPRDNRLRDMQIASTEAIQIVQNYINDNPIPEKYNLYGKAYYYYNVELISCLNRYGKGFVTNANKLLASKNQNHIFLLEEPHYFKVIFPQKKIEIEKNIEAIEKLPVKLENREVIVSSTNIQVDSKKVLLEIFDHRQEDGDIISLNFNGNWILKKKQLFKRPLKVVIELNEKGENYLLLHAENLGETPPNTIAIRYYFEGRAKLVVLNSDLDKSEMIRIYSSK